MLISLDTVVNDCSNMYNQTIISHATSQHDISDIHQIQNDNTTQGILDIIVRDVYIPTPVLPPVIPYDNANAYVCNEAVISTMH